MTRRSPQRRPKRLRRWFLAAILLLTATAATWRFASQSISATSLVPYIEAALERAAPGVDLEIANLALRWGGFRRGVDLALQGIVVRTSDARLDVTEVLLNLSLRALLHGSLTPAHIEVVHPSGRLVRDVDGKIRLISTGATGEQPVNGGVFEDLLRDLASEADPARPLTYLRSIRISDAELVLQDRLYDVVWRADSLNLDLYPAGTDIAGTLRANVHIDDHTTQVEGQLAYDGPTRVFDGHLEALAIPVAALIARVPLLRDKIEIRSHASARLGLGIDLDGTLHRFDLNLDLAAGDVRVPGWLDRPEPFHTLTLAGGFVGAGGWHVGPLAIEFGNAAGEGPRIELDGSVANPDSRGTRVAQARLRLPKITFATLERFWPIGVLPDTRSWIRNRISAGAIETLAADAVFRQAVSKPVQLERLAGEFALRGVAAKWHDHAPPVTDLDGRARFDRTNLRIAIDRARVKELELAASQLDMLHLDRRNGEMRIHLEGAGPVSTATDAIDLQLPTFLGTSDSRSDREPSHIAFKADIGFTMRKRVRLPDLALEVDAQVDSIQLDSELAQGRVSGHLQFLSPGSPQRLIADVDLSQVATGLAVLGWDKPVGKAATAQFELIFEGGKARRIESFDLRADGLSTRGSARFRDNGAGLAQLILKSLRSGRTYLDRATVEWTHMGLKVDLVDGEVDLVPLRERPTALAPGRERPFLEVTASDIRRLHLNQGRWLADASGTLLRDGSDWQALEIRASVPREFASASRTHLPEVRLSVQPSRHPGLLEFRLTSEDFGGLVRTLKMSDAVIAGSLTIEGVDVGRRFERGRLSVEASDFSIGDAPLAVRLLSLASLESIANLLQTDELHFDELIGDLELKDERLIVEDVLAHGSSLGWRARGSVDLEASTIDLGGTLIPAYSANRFLNAIPVLREVLVGEGILSVDYRISGTLAAPEIDTNPMSAITPEALRDIFDPGRKRR